MKSDLIKQIMSFHPGAAPPKFESFSYYVGGMTDTGAWHKDVLESQTDEILEECITLLERHDKLVLPSVSLVDYHMALNRAMLFGELSRAICGLCGWKAVGDYKTCGYCGSSNLINPVD